VTEAEWYECTGPVAMVDFLLESGRANDRKLRLFAVACCRQIWHMLPDPGCRLAVEVAERFADGNETLEQLVSARMAAAEVPITGGMAGLEACQAPLTVAAHDAVYPRWHIATADFVAEAVLWSYLDGAEACANVEKEQAEILRDLFGNPFRPVTVEPTWLAWNRRKVADLVRGIYDDRAYEWLGLLADALEDAGCANPQLLGHLRGPGPHWRGCWAIDLLCDAAATG
jgi:hypothetical protein